MWMFIIKLVIALAIIITATQIARVKPDLAGLIAVMPLTGLIVMVWVWHDNGGDAAVMNRYTLGAVWGIIPAILFFLTSYICFRKQLHLGVVLALSFAVWVAGALVHQYFISQTK